MPAGEAEKLNGRNNRAAAPYPNFVRVGYDVAVKSQSDFNGAAPLVETFSFGSKKVLTFHRRLYIIYYNI